MNSLEKVRAYLLEEGLLQKLKEYGYCTNESLISQIARMEIALGERRVTEMELERLLFEHLSCRFDRFRWMS